MPHPASSLIEISNLDLTQINSLFLSAQEFSKNQNSRKYSAGTAALLFFEPSTRTRFSFEAATARLGLYPLVFEGGPGTSLEKGESIEDTVLNIAAMEPQVVVIRCGDSVDLMALQRQLKMPLINAGWGMKGHPTQALLDALTMKANHRNFAQEKLLVIGDVKHSRVMSSHFQLARLLGYEIAVCAPKEFLPDGFQGKHFQTLAGGMAWATSIMALRVQHERHSEKHSLQSYRDQFGINLQKLKSWKSDGLLMHPGPVNYGVELDLDVNQDPRCKILDQVKWGAYLRQALLDHVLTAGAAR